MKDIIEIGGVYKNSFSKFIVLYKIEKINNVSFTDYELYCIAYITSYGHLYTSICTSNTIREAYQKIV